MPKKTSSLDQLLQRATSRRALLFSLLIIGALIAFEIFNYSTTEFAMTDLLGDLQFAGMRWATILAVAFCGIDFAGIARLFTPETGIDEPSEVWYLFGAWLLAATMNATLTWWGVSIAILQHQSLGNAVIPRETLLKAVPIFVAVMVWLSRVLIIGTFSVAGENLFAQNVERATYQQSRPSKKRNSIRKSTIPKKRSTNRSIQRRRPTSQPSYSSSFSPSPKPKITEEKYTSSPMVAKSRSNDGGKTYQ